MKKNLRREGNINTIDDKDYMVSINQVSIHEDDGNAKIDEIEILRDGLKSVADAIEASTRKYQLPIKEDEVAALVLELGIEDNLFDECYFFLMDNPDKLRALLGLPMGM
ncbi:hypothetical protein COCNU_07G014630 [Cocos nucifera]|uniref:Uncharacterized protein n=1 Tax=Cocos nucifera TaxID=13894 RepID=A0A8K0IG20_COCNU|nr:hypothetical protein COCNU_07G014630 [Cocos nucifera]